MFTWPGGRRLTLEMPLGGAVLTSILEGRVLLTEYLLLTREVSICSHIF